MQNVKFDQVETSGRPLLPLVRRVLMCNCRDISDNAKKRSFETVSFHHPRPKIHKNSKIHTLLSLCSLS